MSRIIGLDEAGLGPNLGPLVVAATVWEFDGSPRRADWSAGFASEIPQGEAASADGPSPRSPVRIADSKAVFQPGRGLAELERAVLPAVAAASGTLPATFDELLDLLGESSPHALRQEAWASGRTLRLPCDLAGTSAACEAWSRAEAACGVKLLKVAADVVTTARFNAGCREPGSKGQFLSRVTLELLRRVWDPMEDRPTLVLGDKHGGRNRYAGLLQEICGGLPVLTRDESSLRSLYVAGPTELEFAPRAERHVPVALASMTAKYVRELAMRLFNDFWREQVPGLHATQGYPVDARRFREETSAARARLGMADSDFWRVR